MTWKIRGITIVAPSIKDPRVFMICVLITYTIVGQTLLSFDHAWSQILTSLTLSCVIDTVVSYRKTRQIILPVSGVITGLGLGLLIEAIPLWPFIVAPILAIGSKAFIKFQGKHIFNPSNFGLTALLLLFPTTVTTLAAQWSGSLFIVIIILMIGGFTSFRVSRWDLVLAFLGSFVIMSFIENLVTQNLLNLLHGEVCLHGSLGKSSLTVHNNIAKGQHSIHLSQTHQVNPPLLIALPWLLISSYLQMSPKLLEE